MRDRTVPWPPSRDYFQHVVAKEDVAEDWDVALVAVVFFLARADTTVAGRGNSEDPSLTSVVGVAAAAGTGSDSDVAFRTGGRRRRR